MNQRILAVATLLLPPFWVGAQPTQMQYDSLKARVGLLEKAVNLYGDAGFMGPQISCGELEAHRPPGDREFPNGEYNIPFRQKQLGCGVNAVAAEARAASDAVAAMQLVVGGLGLRMPPNGRTVPEYVNSAIAAMPTSSGAITTAGNLYVPGKIVIGGPCKHPDAQAQLQICALSDANIYAESNLSGGQFQNAAAHVGMWSLSGDGGMRQLQNGYASVNCVAAIDPAGGTPFQNCLRKFTDPTREYSAIGTDSRGTWCVVRAEPNLAHEATQDVCLHVYEPFKVVAWETWRPGWKWEMKTSSGLATFNQIFKVPTL